VVRFAQWERFFPCSIDWLLHHSRLRDWKNPRFVRTRPTQIDLYRYSQFDSMHQFYLDVFGGQSGEPILGRHVSAPMYVATQLHNDFVEITYLMLYAHQGAQTFAALKPGRPFLCVVEDFGSHQGDLEWICVRTTTDLTRVLEVGFEAHGNVTFFPRGSFLAEGEHPIVHASLNGHACLPGADTSGGAVECTCTHSVRGLLATVDVTTGRVSDGGVVWRPFDMANGLVVIGLDETSEPIGDQLWSKFAGRLGDRLTYAFRTATYLDGGRLGRDEWLYVRLLVALAPRLQLVPARYRSGIGPAGPGDSSRCFMRCAPPVRAARTH
jgi:hypothetical protein